MGTEQSIETKRIDYLGITPGICHEIGLIAAIDQAVNPSERQVSCGAAVLAMVLNGLGFTSQALYLMSQFLKNRSASRLCRTWQTKISTTTAIPGGPDEALKFF